MRLCEVAGCDRKYLARGMCRMHYERDRRGVPLNETPLVRRTPAERFWAKVEKLGDLDCWLWTGALFGRDKPEGQGYGYFWNPGGSNYAHRFAYELECGPIPDGLVLDHLCRVRRCVNPSHLEIVTPRENNLRGVRWAS